MRVAIEISLSEDERQHLTRLSKSHSASVRLAERYQIVLLAAQGLTNEEIGEELGISRQKAARWRQRYAGHGLAGIEKDATRPGGKPRLTERKVEKVTAWTTQTTPDNATHWSQRLMAEKAGISMSAVGRIWKNHGLKPQKISPFKLSNDKHFPKSWRPLSVCICHRRKMP